MRRGPESKTNHDAISISSDSTIARNPSSISKSTRPAGQAESFAEHLETAASIANRRSSNLRVRVARFRAAISTAIRAVSIAKKKIAPVK